MDSVEQWVRLQAARTGGVPQAARTGGVPRRLVYGLVGGLGTDLAPGTPPVLWYGYTTAKTDPPY